MITVSKINSLEKVQHDIIMLVITMTKFWKKKRGVIKIFLPRAPTSPLVSTVKQAGWLTTPPSKPGPNATIFENFSGPTSTRNGLLVMCWPLKVMLMTY